MQVAIHNKVKVYNLTSGKSLPEWLEERKRNKKLAGGDHRIELLHDLEFPHFSRCMFRTANGTNLFCAGDYPPRLKCFDVNDLSMKYSFNADMPILSGVSLSPDYRKFALRGEGRQITVHHSAAIVDRIRVPQTQRCLIYHENTAELVSSGTSHEIFRFSLETGCFVESYKSGSDDGVNCVDHFRGHGLILAACVDGHMEAWDSRSATCAGRVRVTGEGSSVTTSSAELTHVSTDSNGFLACCGTDFGQVVIYDIRLQRPLLVKDHMNGLPIVKTYFFQGHSTSTGESTHVLSADLRSLKIWNKHLGGNFSTIEAPADIYDFTVLRAQCNMAPPYECDDSGVICLCCDTPRVQVHFIPQLGVAPRWASFLDTITEELEEKDSTVVYDDYRFVGKDEMDALGIRSQDLADGKVRPAMHGCFIENTLYRELKAVVDPSGFNRFVADSKKKKTEAVWANRISKFKRRDPTEDENAAVASASSDPRFAGKMSANAAAFAVDRTNPEYAKLLAKIEERQKKSADRKTRYESDLFKIVADQTAANQLPETVGADESRETDETAQIAAKSFQSLASNKQRGKAQTPLSTAGPGPQPSSGRSVTFFESKAGANFTATEQQIHEQRKRDRNAKLSLEERLKKLQKK